MKNLNLSAIISGYKSVFENLPNDSTYNYPEENPDYDYDDVLDNAYQSMHDVMSALLHTQEFVFVVLPEGWMIKIFNTAEESDAYINHVTSSTNSNATTVKLTYEEFMHYAQDSECVLSYYCSNHVDGCVDFSLMMVYSENDIEEDVAE